MLLLLCASLALQVFTNSQNAIFISGTANTNDITTKEASISSNGGSLSGGSQDETALKTVFDNLHQDGIWFGTSRTYRDIVRSRARKSIRIANRLWPNAEVPYQISTFLRLQDLELLRQSFEAFHLYTCIRFREANASDADYVTIVNGGACNSYGSYGASSYGGRVGGRQWLSLNGHCLKKAFIIRILGLSIGFVDQHCRPDRDEYVTIEFRNMLYEYRLNFVKFSVNFVNFYGIPYDYLSIMHGGQYLGSSNGERTIVTRNGSYQELIGKSTGLSFRDAKLANMMYRCSEVKGCKNMTCPGEGFVGQDCRCWCPSGNSNVTAEHCAEDIGATNTTCAQEGFIGQDCRRRCLFGNCNETNENVGEVNKCENITCPGEEFVGKDSQCWCPSGNSNTTANHSAEDTGDTNTTCAQEGLIGKDCRRRCSFGNCNETNENVRADQADMKLSLGHLAAIAVGSAVFLSATLGVFILAVHRRRLRRQEEPCSQFPAAETEVVQNIAEATEYCSLDLQSSVCIYAVLNTEDPTYTSLQPDTDTATYCQLQMRKTAL